VNYNVIFVTENNEQVDRWRNTRLEPMIGSLLMDTKYNSYKVLDKKYEAINMHTINVTAIVERV
jgi:hypothetical protein